MLLFSVDSHGFRIMALSVPIRVDQWLNEQRQSITILLPSRHLNLKLVQNQSLKALTSTHRAAILSLVGTATFNQEADKVPAADHPPLPSFREQHPPGQHLLAEAQAIKIHAC